MLFTVIIFSRLVAQNGDFIKVETQWSSVVNPWSQKLESIIAKHHTVQVIKALRYF